jgi:multidrug transporter EmrE-like cation transporter
VNSAWTLVLAAGVNSTLGNLLLKKSSTTYLEQGLWANIFNAWFIGGMAFYGINVLIFARALASLPVSAAYPVLAGSSFLLLILTNAWLFSERLSAWQYGGIATVLVGILLIGVGGGK